MNSISAAALADRLGGGSPPLVLDVRDPATFDEWHVPGSRNVDIHDELRDDTGAAKRALRGLPTDTEIVTVCGMGIVSQRATELLREMGYEANTLEEGMVGWSKVHRLAEIPLELPGTLLQVARPGKGCLSYVLVSRGEAAVFDPSQYTSEYESLVEACDADPVGVYDTHAHADHVSGARELAESLDVPYHLHPADAIAVDAAPIEDGQTFRLGDVPVEVVHTPGHSPGGATFDIDGRALLTGDTLFHESVGRVELGATVGLEDADVDANAAALYESIQRLLDRDEMQAVLPAHDPGTPDPPVVATVAEVKRRNPDVRRDRSGFVREIGSIAAELPPNAKRIKLANVGLETIDTAERTTVELGPNRCAAE